MNLVLLKKNIIIERRKLKISSLVKNGCDFILTYIHRELKHRTDCKIIQTIKIYVIVVIEATDLHCIVTLVAPVYLVLSRP